MLGMVKFTWWDQIEVVGLVKFVSGGDYTNLKCFAHVTLHCGLRFYLLKLSRGHCQWWDYSRSFSRRLADMTFPLAASDTTYPRLLGDSVSGGISLLHLEGVQQM